MALLSLLLPGRWTCERATWHLREAYRTPSSTFLLTVRIFCHLARNHRPLTRQAAQSDVSGKNRPVWAAAAAKTSASRRRDHEGLASREMLALLSSAGASLGGSDGPPRTPKRRASVGRAAKLALAPRRLEGPRAVPAGVAMAPASCTLVRAVCRLRVRDATVLGGPVPAGTAPQRLRAPIQAREWAGTAQPRAVRQAWRASRPGNAERECTRENRRFGPGPALGRLGDRRQPSLRHPSRVSGGRQLGAPPRPETKLLPAPLRGRDAFSLEAGRGMWRCCRCGCRC